MSTITPSTGEQKRDNTSDIWPANRVRTYIHHGVVGNELVCTERPWAAKPPPGMESEPLTWESIKRNLGT